MTALDRALRDWPVMQAGTGPVQGDYLDARPEHVLWGRLPCETDPPILTVADGAVLTLDTVSHEGILNDQGRDPVAYFAGFGVPEHAVLADARAVADQVSRDPDRDGPHVITGPVAVQGARPGDLLAVEVLRLVPRTGYGLVSSRHGRGALPDELPVDAAVHCVFGTAERAPSGPTGRIAVPGRDGALRFPLRPFLGVMGVAVAGDQRPHSVPPGVFGGNLDIRLLGPGATLYLPVQVPGASFYTGDPHFSQGDGEVALTAFEAPLRATLRLSVVRPGSGTPMLLHAEDADLLIPIGLDADLDEALRECVRCALELLEATYGLDRPTAYAYLSAAGDFAELLGSQPVRRSR